MERKRRTGNSILRAAFVAVSLMLQAGWLLVRIIKLNEYYISLSIATSVLSLVVVLKLYSNHATNSAIKMAWIMLILAFPVMGLALYLLIEVCGDLGNTGKQLASIQKNLRGHFAQTGSTLKKIEEESLTAANLCSYLWNHTTSPVYDNTNARYYGEAAEAFEAMKTELEKAESFIFMEYFIVNDGSACEELLGILERKLQQGVEVRLMYDDIGSIGYVNFKFARALNELGIRCKVFNPALPVLNLFMNHRDHRKITVIDGKVAFTGGFNLSDEYFGRKFPYGKWKDTGLRLEGGAAESLTAEFLEMWNIGEKTKDDYRRYLSVSHSVPGAQGFVQPYSDNPLGKERAAENVYLNLICGAQRSLWLMTPYLIITDEMNRALGLAAKRGVDVRIITPGIPDKKTVYSLTRSYYAGLASQGVRIFEWTPGFCHAKQCLCDGRLASIGTSNLDYRSLYHHFENNVLLFDCEAVTQMQQDFEATFDQCREVTERYRTGRKAFLLLWQCILRLFAPLM